MCRIAFAGPGQFVFAWIPGVGEKPFSIMDDDPLTLGILERGPFTEKINSLGRGDEFYVRGPYVKPLDNVAPFGSEVVLVGGGCGAAGISLIAKEFQSYCLNLWMPPASCPVAVV